MVNLHNLPDTVQRYLERCPHPIKVTTAHEDELLGTGGTLLRNRAFFGTDPVTLAHTDNLSLFDISAFLRAYAERPSGVEITIMTFRADDPTACGIVELDEYGIVQAFHEKVPNPPENIASAAVYVLGPSVLATRERLGRAKIDFSTEVLPRYMQRINGFHNDVYHRDIRTLPSLLAARKEISRAASAAGRLLEKPQGESWESA